MDKITESQNHSAGRAPLIVKPNSVPVIRRGLLDVAADYMRDPAFPLALVLVWYPLWWILGLTQPVLLVATLLMTWRLIGRKPLRVVKGFGWWLLFLMIAALGVFVVQADAPGAVAGASNTRYLTWALRMLWYLEATVVLIYIVNFLREITVMRLARVISVMFVTITIGGLLGAVSPVASFPSLLETLLPHGITSNGFVKSLLHSYLAQEQEYLGTATSRPSGPFPYANSWGLNYACYLPIFVYAWCGKSSGWRRYAAPVCLVASIVPVIYSLNRGLWAVLIIMTIIALFRLVKLNNVRTVIIAGLVAIIGVVVVYVSPLADALAQRFTGHNSNEGRFNLQSASISSVLHASPIIGLGTTRDVQGNFYSIADGMISSCPACGSPPFGTQGSLWLFVFANGLLGTAFVLFFFIGVLWRNRRVRSPQSIASILVLIGFIITTAIYDFSITAMFPIMAAVAVLGNGVDTSEHPPIGGAIGGWRYRMQTSVILLCCAGGVGVGALWQTSRGPTFVGTASVWLPMPPKDSPMAAGRLSTLDTEARFIRSPEVQRAINPAQRIDGRSGRGLLYVDASPNSRILNVHYTSEDPEQAKAGASAAATSLSTLRLERLHSARDAETRAQQDKLANIERTSRMIENALNVTDGRQYIRENSKAGIRLPNPETKVERRYGELAKAAETSRMASLRGGQSVAAASSTLLPSRWNVALTSGAAIGLSLGLLLSRLSAFKGERIDKYRSRARFLEFGLLSHEIQLNGSRAISEVHNWWRPLEPASFVVAGKSSAILRKFVDGLNAERNFGQVKKSTLTKPMIVLVADGATRISEINRHKSLLEAGGAFVCGIVVGKHGKGATNRKRARIHLSQSSGRRAKTIV
ncbi:O-antigen ligase family protein [Spelaeicoccus albus]|uniref:O-antigen ligase-like membrane protein n=1 Tax=Spelaeicoccus albus TaxID=1280376 RepID=A0A7Z0D5B1_9MICO|nr:O-antigen ligase family protein [Spelaeicoccus albus]NYI69161.1 hypothetical protein [Spelaeicoccus albus]